MGEPIANLDPGGKASIVSYNVPDKTAYDGRNTIEFKLPPLNPDDPEAPHEYFNTAASTPPTRQTLIDIADIEARVRAALQTGVYDRRIFPNIVTPTNTLRVLAPTSVFGAEEPTRDTAGAPFLSSVGVAIPLSNHMANLEPRAVALRMAAGERLNVYRSLHGTYTYNSLLEPVRERARPRLLLVETYRLSSFLGNYGAGRTLATFSLLPGEKTTISVKSYTKTETEAKSASSILDSFSHDSSQDFENSVQAEQIR
jgi:hypothetical protein